MQFSGKLEGLRKDLFAAQFMAQQSGVLHPKIAAVCREIQHMADAQSRAPQHDGTRLRVSKDLRSTGT